MISAAVTIFALLTSSATPLPPQWNNWKYVRTATVKHASIQSVAIPPSIYASAQRSLRDLRIIDSNGALVPFAIETPRIGATEEWIDAKLTDEGFVAGHYSQAVAVLSEQRGEYNALDLTTPLTNFATRVDVDASDDGSIWRTIRSDAPIYDYKLDGLATHTRVTFPTSTARYLRARIIAGSKAFPIAGIRVARLSEGAPENTRYTLRMSTSAYSAVDKTTTFTMDGIDGVPINRLRLDSQTSRFSRTVDVQFKEDGADWSTAVTRTVSRVAPGQDSLSLDFDESQASHWRLVVHDGDNAPLRNVNVDAYGIPRRIYFDSQPDQNYRLIYGNQSAIEPAFDFSATHQAAALHRAIETSLGEPTINGSFVSSVPEQPWSDRNPWILWLALSIAVLGVGTLALRTLSAQPPK